MDASQEKASANRPNRMTLLKTAMISCLGWVRWLVRCFRQGDGSEEAADADMDSSRGRAIAFLRQVLAVAGATIRRFSDEEGMHLAAGVAFYALLSSVPAALVTVSMFSYFLEPEEITDWLVNRLGEETPVSADFLLEAAQGARAIRGPVGVLGFLGAILSSTLFFAALMRSINRAWGLIGTGSRTFFRRKLWEFAFLFGLALLLLFAYAAANIYDVLKEGPLPGTDLRLAADNAVWRFFLGMVPFVAITGILLLLYRFVPTTEVKWRHVLLPSVLAGLALIIANGLLGWYIRNLSYYNVVYGSLAGVIVLLLWVYICANILIAGAALSATLGEMGRRQPLPDRRPNS